MHYLLNKMIMSSVIGISTTASTYLGLMVYDPKDWRDLVALGIVGVVLSSKYVHDRHWVSF